MYSPIVPIRRCCSSSCESVLNDYFILNLYYSFLYFLLLFTYGLTTQTRPGRSREGVHHDHNKKKKDSEVSFTDTFVILVTLLWFVSQIDLFAACDLLSFPIFDSLSLCSFTYYTHTHTHTHTAHLNIRYFLCVLINNQYNNVGLNVHSKNASIRISTSIYIPNGTFSSLHISIICAILLP